MLESARLWVCVFFNLSKRFINDSTERERGSTYTQNVNFNYNSLLIKSRVYNPYHSLWRLLNGTPALIKVELDYPTREKKGIEFPRLHKNVKNAWIFVEEENKKSLTEWKLWIQIRLTFQLYDLSLPPQHLSLSEKSFSEFQFRSRIRNFMCNLTSLCNDNCRSYSLFKCF